MKLHEQPDQHKHSGNVINFSLWYMNKDRAYNNNFLFSFANKEQEFFLLFVHSLLLFGILHACWRPYKVWHLVKHIHDTKLCLFKWWTPTTWTRWGVMFPCSLHSFVSIFSFSLSLSFSFRLFCVCFFFVIRM